MDVLIVIDMQECFLAEIETDLPERIRDHIDDHEYDKIVFSQLVNHEASPFSQQLDWKHCTEDGAIGIVPELEAIASDHIVVQKDTYSVFNAEPLEEDLDLESVDTIHLCGIDYDACVLATAFDAFDRNLDIEILCDLTESTADDPSLEEAAEKIVERNFSSE